MKVESGPKLVLLVSHRSVIMLESNSGYLQLHELLQAAGHRGRVSLQLRLLFVHP